jgi:hypothetical protein
VTSYDVQPWTFHLHLGHVHHDNTVDERVDLWHASAAVVHQVNDRLQWILDAGVDTNTDRASHYNPVFVILGAIWSPRPNFDVDIGWRHGEDDHASVDLGLAGLAWRW